MITSSSLRFREASLNDAHLLLEWRNNPDTRSQFLNTAIVDWEAHITWLKNTIEDNTRKLFIAENNSCPIGTVRADFKDGYWHLSWTVVPEARGHGYGKAMVQWILQTVDGPFIATIKKTNFPSQKIAEGLGFSKKTEENGLTIWTYYSRH